jgi:hypothetical protein
MDKDAFGTGDLHVKGVIGKGILPVCLAFKPNRSRISRAQGCPLLLLLSCPKSTARADRLRALTPVPTYITTVVYIVSSGE